MKKYLVITAILFLLAGCGYSPEDPVYDTSSNPRNFPQMALNLLDRIEDSTYFDFESISNGFGDLYSENPELLDNQPWQQVIKKLGLRFDYCGDNFRSAGLGGFYRASGFYELAVRARPNDEKLITKSELFNVWRDALDAEETSLKNYYPFKTGGIEERLDLLKFFALTDSLSREFTAQYLAPEILKDYSTNGIIDDIYMDKLEPADKAVLAYLGRLNWDTDKKIAEYTSPDLDILAAELIPIRPNWYRFDIYLMPHEKITQNLFFETRVDLGEKGDPDSPQNYMAYQFEPSKSSLEWQPENIEWASHIFYFADDIDEIEVGLLEKDGDNDKNIETDKTRQFVKIYLTR